MNKHTYRFIHDCFTEDEIADINNIFHKRGWIESKENTTLLWYYYAKSALPKFAYNIKADICSNINWSKPNLTDKDIFYKFFTEKDIYMPIQYDINDITKSIFDNNIWIAKPVDSFSGKGIEVFTNYDEMLSFKKVQTRKYIVSEYITNPLLLSEHKFHFRVPLLYYKGKSWIAKNIFMYTAKNKYEKNDWTNKDIHDTHLKSSISGNLQFPRDIALITTSNKRKTIRIIKSGIYNIARAVTKTINNYDVKCWSNSKNCFEILGLDVIFDDNLNPWLLEINSDAGFRVEDRSYMINIIEGVMQTIIDPIYNKHYIFLPVEDFLAEVHININDSSFEYNITQTYGNVPSNINNLLEAYINNNYHNKSGIYDINYIPIIKPLTYRIMTDLPILETNIRKIFNNRGWIESQSDNVTFVYIWYQYIQTPQNVYSIKSEIGHELDYGKRPIVDKSELYNRVEKYNIMIKQYVINKYNWNKVKPDIFKDTVWLLKPDKMYGGIGIVTFDNYQKYYDYVEKEITNKPNYIWVLAKYILNPLTYQGYKFHLRVPLIYFEGESWLTKEYYLVTASKKYIKGDWNNKEIHDTHCKRAHIPGLKLPENISDIDSSETNLFETMHNEIYNIAKIVTKVLNDDSQIKCFPEHNKCIGIIGMDIMFDSDLNAYLLEINKNPGFCINNERPATILEGIFEEIIDKIYQPLNKVDYHNYLVKVI
jgi:hypothetical protein